MTDIVLPDGLLTMIKTATRAMVAAAAVPGSTGAERVEQLTGYSRGQISKWQADSFAVLMPAEVLFLLEFITQRPIFAGVLAALTGHRLVPIASDGAAPDTLMASVVELTGSHSRFLVEATSALADLEVTPGEAKALLKAGMSHQDQLNRMLRLLAEIAEGRAAPGDG